MSKRYALACRGARQLRRALAPFALASALLLLPLASALAVNLNTVNTPVTQNFDAIGTSATAALPTDFRADKQTTVQTVGSYASAVTATEQRAGNSMSSTATNGIYNFAAGDPTTATERAVGFVSSGTATKSANLYAKYTNTTGAPLSALRVSYDVERYRDGSNAQGFRFQLFYSTDGTNWTSAGTSFLTGFAANADNNGCAVAPCETKSVSNQALGIPTVANNADIYLAWNYSVTSGTTTTNAQALGIDNISVTPLGSSVGAAGVRTTDIEGTDDGGYAMALQPDGKTVVGGYAVNNSGDKDFALVRYNYDGMLDTTFGTGGKVTTDFNSTSDRVWGVALQPDGKIVAAGETVSAVFPGTNDIALARYNSDGSLDTTFGGTGKVTTDHGAGANNAAYAVALSGTNVIVAGYETVSGNNDFMVARYTSAGALDPTFGTLGVTTLGFSGGNDVARAVAVDGGGNIVLGGYANNGSDDDFAVARFTSAGALDTTFVGGAGKAALDIYGGSADQAFALAITPTGAPNAGTIVLAGSAYNPATGNKDFALVRYTSAGALDTANFGGGTGVVKTDFLNSPDVAQSVYVRPDGFIVAGGFARFSASGDDFAVARYTPNGSPDTTFNGTGKLTMRVSNDDERIYAIAREFDGKIVAAGFATTANSKPARHDFAVARFNADGSLDSASPTALTNPDLLLTLAPDQDSVIAGQSFSALTNVTNRGPGNATNVVITFTIPAGVTLNNVAQSAGTVQVNGQTVTNTIPSLAAGQSASLSVALNTTQAGTFVSTATVTSNETDLTPSNNTDSAAVRAVGVKDLSFTPSTVVGGCQDSTATITFTSALPAGGAVVNISDSDPSAASAPASVNVAGNQSSVQVNVTTHAVASNKTVRFEATLGTTSFVRRLVVNAGACN
ncbi:MAG TPA: hypothetical protein VFA21_10875 [Pyrinomonadaceae bacterium]|nr:hypothetical protein [Pyrinomonadaceae bacterium]